MPAMLLINVKIISVYEGELRAIIARNSNNVLQLPISRWLERMTVLYYVALHVNIRIRSP
jgi:hypothetical protein